MKSLETMERETTSPAYIFEVFSGQSGLRWWYFPLPTTTCVKSVFIEGKTGYIETLALFPLFEPQSVGELLVYF